MLHTLPVLLFVSEHLEYDGSVNVLVQVEVLSAVVWCWLEVEF